MNKTTQLRRMIEQGEMSFLMEAHNGLSAKIVEETGFMGIWASGLSISASLGVRDNNEASWTQITDVLEYMSDATTIPILMDGDTGFGNFNNARRLVTKLEKINVAGVCVEDKLFPKTNSFLKNSADALADIAEFSGKIAAMKDAQKDPDFVVVARLESFIAGVGLDDALTRAAAYERAGADALLVHSKRADAKDLDEFMAGYRGKLPVIIVPTKYYTVPMQHFRDLGISTVIWANHNCRAAIDAMKRVSRQIYEEESLMGVEDRIVSVSEVFRIQGNDELEEAEKKYLPKGTSETNAVILAASRGNNLDALTQDKPKTMIRINHKSLLENEIDILEQYGIQSFTVVRGYKKEAVDITNARMVDNDDYQDTSVVYSLALARDAFEQQVLAVYGDLIFKKHLIYDALTCSHDVCIVTSRSNRHALYDTFVYAKETPDPFRSYTQQLTVDRVAPPPPSLSEATYCGNFIGILAVKGKAVPQVRDMLQQIMDRGERTLSMQAFLSRILAAGQTIGIVTANDEDWMDINTLSDIENALERM